VGKRALPALDLSTTFETAVPVIAQPQGMVMGLAFPTRDQAVETVLTQTRARGALTFALSGEAGEYPFAPSDRDPFACQEIFEVLYHMLGETIHVYFEHREQGHDVGASSFLYPFLGRDDQQLDRVVEAVQGSMQKAAEGRRGQQHASGAG
jgi:D-sedoheptulose 7-phosphate isomerase